MSSVEGGGFCYIAIYLPVQCSIFNAVNTLYQVFTKK